MLVFRMALAWPQQHQLEANALLFYIAYNILENQIPKLSDHLPGQRAMLL